jgi:serine/threonine-protein kinase
MSQSPRHPPRRDESFDETIDARAAALGSFRDTIEKNPHATIEPSRDARDASAAGALAMLAGLRGDPARGRRSLEIEKTIGEGGMGVVHLASQVSVGRKVAVKTLRPDARSEANTLRLLREAWVTGALEHPNVVPVYDVGLDEHGAPVIVLKRIEGVHWGELMNDERRVHERFKARDLLEWNIGILMQVCNAVHFAHSRGIVHRDLKPENVMIGEFGEVYLLDWGIAVSLRDDGTGRFPLARDAKQLAGTPCYMAPESLGDGPITERTDVFLLGAILYELITGNPPHTGETVLQILASILQREPAFPDEAPLELVRIAKRAMAIDPDGRFETAEQVRLALQGFLQHRESEVLAAGAERALESLKRELADSAEVTPERRQRIYNAFGGCRFGFREALRIWSGNELARSRFREAVTAMIEFELASRDPRSAHVLIGELDEDRPDLAERIEASRRALEEEARRARDLEKLGEQYDASVGRRTRSFMALLAGIIWSTFPLAAVHFDNGHNTRRSLIVAPIAMLGLFSLFAIWARESMTKTRFNRSVLGLVFLVLATQVLLQVGTMLLGFEEARSSILNLFLWGTYSLALAVTLEKRLAFAGAGFYIAFLIACLRPEWRWYLFSAGNIVLTANMVAIWRPVVPPT